MRVSLKGLTKKRDPLNRRLNITDIAGLPMAGAMKRYGEIKCIARCGVQGADGVGDTVDIGCLTGVSLLGRLCGARAECREP